MRHEQNQVADFMRKASQATPEKPMMPDFSVRALRFKLIHEELRELQEALALKATYTELGDVMLVTEEGTPDITEAYDAVLDLLVVVLGTAVSMGLDVDPGFQAVHESNMSKFIDGHRREDGKWVKGPSYKKVELGPIIERLRLE